MGRGRFPSCSAAPLDVRRELTQSNPSVGQYIGYLDWVSDAGWQAYHGVLLSFQRRSTGGLSTNANYTWSTCEGLINQGGGPLNVGTGYLVPASLINPPANQEAIFELDRGPCSTNRTHIFNMTASVETPEFASPGLRAVASGWRLSGVYRAMSGATLNVQTGLDRALTGMQNQRPNQILDDPYGAKTIDNWLNPQAFEQPALGTHGNARRNGYVGPGRQVVDLSLVRTFRFLGTHALEARIEAFNAFNWFQLSNPNTTLNNANFGRILSSGDPRVMQFALKYSFYGPTGKGARGKGCPRG